MNIKEQKEVKIEDFINETEPIKITFKECKTYCKCICGGNLIPTEDGLCCNICG